MTGIEAALLGLATTGVKSAVKLWLGDHEIAGDVAADAIEVASSKLASEVDRRKLRRVYEQISEAVYERLEPLLATEYARIPPNELLATITAVQDTFARAALTDADLFAVDLDPAYLDRFLRSKVHGLTELLSADATVLYRLVLRETCSHVVEVARTLPRFGPSAATEILRRETEILSAITRVLERMPHRRTSSDFEHEYRHLTVSILDRIEIFGATLQESSRVYPLSVAFISLTAVRNGSESLPESLTAGARPIEDVLRDNTRLFIRAHAGLGKTTLLQWLAVRSARQDFGGPLEDWNSCIPFFVPLRRYAATELPDVSSFVKNIGVHIADEMPDGWVQEQLRSGRGIVLIDGVDELPQRRRSEVKRWLRDLIASFPQARLIVTSRPGAAAQDWLDSEQFFVAELLPMSNRNVEIFIGRWFAAMRDGVADLSAKAELESLEASLLVMIGARLHLRRLAGYPLLCALICALYRDRRAQLPNDRMELYDVALQMLLERRDAEREISDLDGLSRTSKLLLLGDIAYWLVRNDWSDASTKDIVARIGKSLSTMPAVTASEDSVYRYLLERTGLLREPAHSRTDFVHRTFQEYLAAKAAVEDGDIGVLISNAHLDHWHEVVVMAAGHCTREKRIQLLSGLAQRANRRVSRSSPSLHLVAAACLETSPDIPNSIRRQIQRSLRSLIPPQSVESGEALAVGPFVLDLLMHSRPKTDVEIASTIRAAARIGGENALPVIKLFAEHESPDVRSELINAWSRFEPVLYAQSVLSLMDVRQLTVTDPALASGLKYIERVERLQCAVPPGGSIDFIPKSVNDLRLNALGNMEISELRSLNALRSLQIAGSAQVRVDLPSWLDVPILRTLIVNGVQFQFPAAVDKDWSGLDRLALVRMNGAAPKLTSGVRVRDLLLDSIVRMADLTALQGAIDVERIVIENCQNLVDISVLPVWSVSLHEVSMSGCGVTRLRALTKLNALRSLTIRNAMGSADLDLFELSELTHPIVLSLVGYNIIDLRPLAKVNGMIVCVSPQTTVVGERAVRSLRRIAVPRQPDRRASRSSRR